MTVTQVKSGNRYKSILNEIRHIIFSLYQANKITKKLYKKIMNSITL